MSRKAMWTRRAAHVVKTPYDRGILDTPFAFFIAKIDCIGRTLHIHTQSDPPSRRQIKSWSNADNSGRDPEDDLLGIRPYRRGREIFCGDAMHAKRSALSCCGKSSDHIVLETLKAADPNCVR